jgi:peroxiredoxin
MSEIVLGRVLPWLLVGAGAWLTAWLGVNFLRQLGKVLLRLDDVVARLESIETRLGAIGPPARPTARLPVGAAAPDFELPDLAGRRRSLAEFRGRRVLLIFFNPKCGFCVKMAPDLAALPADGAGGWPLPVVVSTGDAEENRRLVQEQGIRAVVLIQERSEVALDRYDIRGTPMGFLVDERGNIASEVASGAQALMALAVAAKDDAAGPGPAAAAAAPRGKADKGLAASRLNRSGLPAGTPAPGFRLPRLDGAGERTLEDFRGRRLLLVFSDPECGPCDQLAPHLERLHRERTDPALLVIGRRDPELNRRKVAKLGLTVPVVLQRSWEASLLYGMFATPVAYLIDEQGVIAADLATGVEPILELIARLDTPAPAPPAPDRGDSVPRGQEALSASG